MPLHARNSANSLTVWLDPVCSGQKFEVMMATRGATVGALMLGDEPLLHTGTSYQVQVPSLSNDSESTVLRCRTQVARDARIAPHKRHGQSCLKAGPDRSYMGGGGRRAHQPTPS